MVVSSMVMPKYEDPKIIYTPKDIQTDMLSDHGVNLTYMQAWRAKEKALEFLRGHHVDSYSRLPIYFYILEKTYLGSVVKLQKTGDDCFLYALIVLSASIKGWEHCRPVIIVDGTFLKSAYRGIMLTASTIDAAGNILPLAYAVVDLENDASWRWCFEQFKHAYGKIPNICIVSNMNENILKATSTVYTGMSYYACMWHIWTNVRSKFKKGHLKLSELWYRVHAMVNRTWTLTSNIAASLNAVTKDARELPVVKLLEYMRTLLECWANEKLLNAKGTFTYLGKKDNK
ncbi:uncharacterized protein LOC142175348 [Nicotiana tabacum]|uniref:Uncharacterized protein LOC142175348 n=1 Tax=Nicotiana tabacum TaxID=4097 RepID=A0AC58TLE2_TOBAC